MHRKIGDNRLHYREVYEAGCRRVHMQVYQQKYTPENVIENEQTKLLWNGSIQTDKLVQNNGPDIVLVPHTQTKREKSLPL